MIAWLSLAVERKVVYWTAANGAVRGVRGVPAQAEPRRSSSGAGGVVVGAWLGCGGGWRGRGNGLSRAGGA